MDPNLCPNGASFYDLPLGSPSATMDYALDFSTQGFDSFATQQPHINIGSEYYQREKVYFDQEVTDDQQPFMDHNVGTNGSHLVDYDLDFLYNQAVNFGSSEDFHHNVSFSPDLGYTDSLLPSSVAPISNNPLMEIVEAATSSPLGQTRRATNNSSRTYRKFSRKDVAELILGVEQLGKRWKKISQLPYFQVSGRTEGQLMNKWRDMTKDADINRKDPEMKDLYDRAKRADRAKRVEKV